MQEGAWSPNSFILTQVYNPYQYAGTQGSVCCLSSSSPSQEIMNDPNCWSQFMDNGLSSSLDHYTTSYNVDPTQGYLSASIPYSYPYECPIHPVVIVPVNVSSNSSTLSDALFDIAFKPCDSRAYDSTQQHCQNGSSPSPPLPEMIPQRPYECGNNQKRDQKPPISFSRNKLPGVKLVDALAEKFDGIDDRDSFPFDQGRSGITIRAHVSS